MYAWLGTCDITEKISRKEGWIDIRYSTEGKATRKLIEQYQELKDFVFSKQGTIKFITLPTYSTVIYNKNKKHKKPEKFESSDSKILRELNELNGRIIELNKSLGRNTLQFHLDLRKNRSGRKPDLPSRKSIHWHLLKDGLHPKRALAKKWLRRLEIDIVSECWTDPEIVSLEVDPQEAQSAGL